MTNSEKARLHRLARRLGVQACLFPKGVPGRAKAWLSDSLIAAAGNAGKLQIMSDFVSSGRDFSTVPRAAADYPRLLCVELSRCVDEAYRLAPMGEDEFAGDATPRSADAIPRSAAELQCEPGAVYAVVVNESHGSGFLADTRPLIRLEAHIFARYTDHAYNTVCPALSSPVEDDSLVAGGAEEYSRLVAAMMLDRSAALQATSWGEFQIMGFNYAACGYDDVETFVADMCQSGDRQVTAFVKLIKSNRPALHALQTKDWAGFALHYNGPSYKKNHYDRKLAENYARYK